MINICWCSLTSCTRAVGVCHVIGGIIAIVAFSFMILQTEFFMISFMASILIVFYFVSVLLGLLLLLPFSSVTMLYLKVLYTPGITALTIAQTLAAIIFAPLTQNGWFSLLIILLPIHAFFIWVVRTRLDQEFHNNPPHPNNNELQPQNPQPVQVNHNHIAHNHLGHHHPIGQA